MYDFALLWQMQIPVMNKKATNSENSVQDHRPEPVKDRSETEHNFTRKENLVEQIGDMEPPIEGMVLLWSELYCSRTYQCSVKTKNSRQCGDKSYLLGLIE